MLAGFFLSVSSASAQVAGICLYATSPDSPDDQVQAFEYTRVERMDGGYRFFQARGRAVTVSQFRYRGVIHYPVSLQPTNPELPELLMLYRQTIFTHPATEPFLTPWINRIQPIVERESMRMERERGGGGLQVGGQTFLNPRYEGVDEGRVVVRHEHGLFRIPWDQLDDEMLRQLVEADERAGEIGVLEVGENRLFNPRYESLASDGMVIRHEQGVARVQFDQLDDGFLNRLAVIDETVREVVVLEVANNRLFNPRIGWVSREAVQLLHARGSIEIRRDSLQPGDAARINELSNGDFWIGDPRFFEWNEADGSYGRVLARSGRLWSDLRIVGIERDKLRLTHAGGTIDVLIDELAGLAGLGDEDSVRMRNWVEQVIEMRLSEAEPVGRRVNRRVIEGQAAVVVEASGRVLQVLDGGMLVAGLSGSLVDSTVMYDVIKEVGVVDPASGERVTLQVGMDTESETVTSDYFEGVCFIEVDSSSVVNGQTARFASLRIVGRRAYQSAIGAQRSITSFRVE